MPRQRADHIDGGYVLILRVSQIQDAVILAVGNHGQDPAERGLVRKIILNISREQIPNPPAAYKFHITLQSAAVHRRHKAVLHFIRNGISQTVLLKSPFPVTARPANTAGFLVSFVTTPGHCKGNADFQSCGHNIRF